MTSATAVRVRGLVKRFHGRPPTNAVDGVDIEIAPGEFIVLLGPSGCGKTTTLRCLAGLEEPDEGSIFLGDRCVFDRGSRVSVPANKRNIGMVFQSYALWPHMTVRRNIAFPLRARRVDKALRDAWVEETATLVDCSTLLDRYPGQLSGGQQQRVALARGLVARPDLLLFDEPLSNLDARLRDQVRAELHELHEKLRFTAVYVTHDQREAFALADRVVVMRAGKVEQIGTPRDVFHAPSTDYVAEFVGMANRLVVDRRADFLYIGDEPLIGDGCSLLPAGCDSVAVRVRPANLTLSEEPMAALPAQSLSFMAQLIDSQYDGDGIDVALSVGGTRLRVRVPASRSRSWVQEREPGSKVAVCVHLEDTVSFDLRALPQERLSSAAAVVTLGAQGG